MSTYQARKLEKVEKEFKKTISVTAKGKEYTRLENDTHIVALFASNVAPDASKKSNLVANLSITDKRTGMNFGSELKALTGPATDRGKYLFGQKANRSGHRAIIVDLVRDDNGKVIAAYDKVTMPDRDYYDIIAMIEAADSVEGEIEV